MGLVESLARRISHKAVVVNKQRIAENTFHISLALKDMKDFFYTPGEFLRLLVGLDQPVKMSEKVRTYSVWNYDADRQIIDIAVCTFSSGVGANWAKNVNIGDAIHFTGPKGKFVLD